MKGELKRALMQIRERGRVRRLSRWSRRGRPDTDILMSDRIGILAGYGNTSYGDYFIGLGAAQACREAGTTPVILGRGQDMRAFTRAGIEAHTLPDRAEGLAEFARATRTLGGLILGGGGLFEDRVDAILSQSLAAGYACRARWGATVKGLPTAVHGVGIEEAPYRFRAVERALMAMIHNARTVAVRDEASVRACIRFGENARLVVDPAVIALSDARLAEVAPNGTVAFIPFARRAWPEMANPTAEAHRRQDIDWAAAAQRLAQFDQVVIVPFHETDLHYLDHISTAITRANPAASITVAPFTPDEPLAVLPLLHQCGSAVTMRYHGFMACHFAGIRDIVSIGDSQKLTVTRDHYTRGDLASIWSRGRAAADLLITLECLATAEPPLRPGRTVRQLIAAVAAQHASDCRSDAPPGWDASHVDGSACKAPIPRALQELPARWLPSSWASPS